MAADRHKELLLAGFIVVVVATAAFLSARFIPFIRLAENWVSDIRLATLTPSMPQSDTIVIVTIDEDTLATLPYRSPLDRRFLANLLRALEHKGVRAIGLDMLLDQPTEPEKDRELHVALRSLRIPVVVAWASLDTGITERQAVFVEDYLRGLERGIPYVARDADGTVRSFYVSWPHGKQRVLGLSSALARTAGVEVPDAETMALAYRSGPDAETPPFPGYPAHSVHLLPHEWFQDRIVLIGADLPLEDRHRTPLAVGLGAGTKSMPGVIIHAHALAQLLEGRRPHRPTLGQQVLIVLLLSAIGILITRVALPAGVRAGTGLGIIAVVWVGGFALYAYAAILAPLVAPTMAFAASAALGSAQMWRRERAQKKFIRDAFSKYLAPNVIAQLEAEPERLALGGEKRETTVLFTDIAAFTTLTEKVDPKLLVPLLNDYFDGTIGILLAHGGTLDKIVGDALHIIFNAPSEQSDHPERAVRCAMELDRFCESFRAKQASQGIAFGETRIGVNTGTTVVGNFGGKDHFDYTAHGDTVNTTARLESVNKYLGTRICVSESTTSRCQHMRFRPAGRLVLKGKREAIQVFEPLADTVDSSATLAAYMKAYSLMERQDGDASRAFAELAQKHPEDGLIAFHARRLASGERGTTIVMTQK